MTVLDRTMMNLILKFLIYVSILLVGITGYSQKGVGAAAGLGQCDQISSIIELQGTVEQVKIGPCEYSTGRSPIGAHVLVKTADQSIVNVHLGPADELVPVTEALKTGEECCFAVFRTDRLPTDHYIAKEVVINKHTVILRNEDLKPFWSYAQ